jgi:hypothetical protein
LIVEGIVALKVVLPFAFVANSFGPVLLINGFNVVTSGETVV